MKTLAKLLSAVLLLTAWAYCQSLATGSITAAGSDCTTAGACIVANINQNTGGAMIQLSGTFTGTLRFESSIDNVTWVAINGTPLNSTTGASSATTANIWQFNVAGASYLRVRASAFSAGPILVTIQPSTASARSGGGGGGSGITSINGDSSSAQTIAPGAGIASTNTSGGTTTVILATALPNGETATTQTVGDNTTKVATDAFVLANAGGTPAFSSITTGTNTAALHMGTGGSLDATGTGTIAATSLTVLSGLPAQAADTVVMNATGGSASPTAYGMPTCTTGADLYNTSTHAWTCVSAGGLSAINAYTLLANSTGSSAVPTGTASPIVSGSYTSGQGTSVAGYNIFNAGTDPTAVIFSAAPNSFSIYAPPTISVPWAFSVAAAGPSSAGVLHAGVGALTNGVLVSALTTSQVVPTDVSVGIANSTTGAVAALTDGATVSWSMSTGTYFANAALTFTVHSGSRTLNVSGLVAGGRYTLVLTQDGTGGESLTGGTGCTWKQAGGGGSTFTLTSSAAAIDRIVFDYDGTNCYATLTKAWS